MSAPEPFFRSGPVSVHLGDVLEVLAGFPDRHFSAVVTDPPYGLEFMGRDWERWRIDDTLSSRFRGERAGAAGEALKKHRGLRVTIGVSKRSSTSRCQGCGRRDVYRKPHDCGEREVWRREIIDPHAAPPTARAFQEWVRAWGLELYRVLRPGGLVLAFGSPRTFHRLTAGLEDAGFEVRRALSWIYGQGYPKAARLSTLTGREEWAGWATDLRQGWEPIVLLHRPHPDGYKGAALEEGGAGLHLAAHGLTADGGFPADVILDEATAAELGPERAGFFYTAKASRADRTQDGQVENDHPTVTPHDLMRGRGECARRPGGGRAPPGSVLRIRLDADRGRARRLRGRRNREARALRPSRCAPLRRRRAALPPRRDSTEDAP